MTQPISEETFLDISNASRCLVEVQAGIIPGTPDPIYKRTYAISSAEWEKADDSGQTARLLAETNGLAQGYAAMLMLQPDRLNWVSTMWIWL